ncbi:MAG: AAA family ATPase [Candidatus Paceibacterota bacterium]
MRLKTIELNGFKSFAQKTALEFDSPIVAVVGPNGSGKSNVVEAIRFVLGEQSMKSMRGKGGSDLIFKGSKNLSKGTKATTTIHFHNKDKVFKLGNDFGENINLNYDLISISREVHSDGMNKYILNGTEVRLKDINQLLSSVNIGASGHHIISQGEADRILNANSKERREMIEDALGLKIYQYKIKESSRKLERTNENMKEVSMLRRENAPHLNFLRKQVDKFEKTKEIEAELLALYREYLKKESLYLEEEKERLLVEKNKLSREIEILAGKISQTEDGGAKEGNKKIEELRVVEARMNEIRSGKGELERKLGRIEGILESKELKIKLSGRCPTCGSEIREVGAEQIESRQNNEKEVAELKTSQTTITREMEKLVEEEGKLSLSIATLKEEINKEMESLRDKEREKFSLKVRHQELSSAMSLINVRLENLEREENQFETEIKEGTVLVGAGILSYKEFQIEDELDRLHQEEAKKKIDRLKIKLEDAGLGNGAEIMKEFKEVSERDQFLAKEMEDLAKSIESLNQLMAELKEKIDFEFKEGVKKINVEFQEFFSLMFGGGTGTLNIVVESKRRKSDDELEGVDEREIAFEQGIEINVSLPHKKVKELHALSGGERSLTSIALLFAMSQVNPPPFLVLDETDAALDEANSRKYGNMLEKLSKHSQLIVVTHNRETMSRAGMLYGVTIGSDGASKLLSVKFDDAVQIAK